MLGQEKRYLNVDENYEEKQYLNIDENYYHIKSMFP